jgi:hypothetical protein
MGLENSLPCLQDLTSGSNTEPNKSSPHASTFYFFKMLLCDVEEIPMANCITSLSFRVHYTQSSDTIKSELSLHLINLC